MKNQATNGAIIYTVLSLIVAVLFLAATIAGEYTVVERAGGTVWVFILSMIILMPLVSSYITRKSGTRR